MRLALKYLFCVVAQQASIKDDGLTDRFARYIADQTHSHLLEYHVISMEKLRKQPAGTKNKRVKGVGRMHSPAAQVVGKVDELPIQQVTSSRDLTRERRKHGHALGHAHDKFSTGLRLDS